MKIKERWDRLGKMKIPFIICLPISIPFIVVGVIGMFIIGGIIAVIDFLADEEKSDG